MKIFPEFRSCWGGAVITPAAEAATYDRPSPEQEVYSHRNKRRSRGGAASQWKPNLNAISESRPITEVDGGGRNVRPTGIANKKAAKVKPKSPAKAAASLHQTEDYCYWKSSQAMAVPAFAPTSFLF